MSARTHKKIDPAIADILRNAEICGPNGTHLKITQQLDPKVYKQCANILTMLGGKWNRSAQATIFQKPIKEVLAEALDDGEVANTKVIRQAFYTPDDTADLLVSVAELLPEHKVLEPSAGGGALADAAIRAGAKQGHMDLIEVDQEACAELRKKYPAARCGNFLEWQPQIRRVADRIIMNPPFNKGQDASHIMHALRFLASDGILVAILPAGIREKSTGVYKYLHQRLADADIAKVEYFPIPEGSFKESGTAISTCILKVTKKSFTED